MSLHAEKQQNKTKKKKKKRESNFLYDFVKVTGIVPTLIWLRPKIIRVSKNVPKRIKGGALIASNHISFVDPITVHCAFWYRRLYCLATKDLFDTPRKEKFFNAMHCIMVDKDNFHMGSFHAVCDRLKAEKAVVIFPEGTVHREGEKAHHYKSGAILMAHISHKPVVPVCIIKRKHWYSRQVAVIGEPIDVNAMCGKIPSMDEIDEASKYIREKENELMEYYYEKYTKKKRKEKSHERL